MSRVLGWICLMLVGITPALAESGTTGGLTLGAAGARRNLLVGAAVAIRPLQDKEQEAYRAVLGREFTSVTPENVMKWSHIHPDRGRYNFAPGDDVVKFAVDHNMKIHGHTLVWHEMNPPWIKELNATRPEMIEILHDHISTVAGHYRGKVQSWDVVNEAFEDSGQFRKSLWHERIGPDYIELAFRFAHEADPDAVLYYNDYSAEATNAKSDAILKHMTRLRADGVPIHGVGFQMHIDSTHYPKPADVRSNLERFAAAGFRIEITEMDLVVNDHYNDPPRRFERQAALYRDMVEAVLHVPALHRLTFWGVADCHSWRKEVNGKPGAPLLFDCDFNPKPVVEALVHLLRRTPEPAQSAPRPESGTGGRDTTAAEYQSTE